MARIDSHEVMQYHVMDERMTLAEFIKAMDGEIWVDALYKWYETGDDGHEFRCYAWAHDVESNIANGFEQEILGFKVKGYYTENGVVQQVNLI